MSDAFDGTGKGFREPSYRAPLIMLLLLLVVIVLLLLGASGALNGPGATDINTNVNPPLLESGPPAD